MAFRRIVITTEKLDDLKEDLNRLFSLSKTKIDFPNLKYEIKQGLKPNTLVVDLNGEGADSFSKKIKDAGVKFGAQVVIKLEKSQQQMKENTENKLKEVIKKVLKEEFDDDFIKYNTERDDEEYKDLSPLEMAEGNVSIADLNQMVKLGENLVNNLLHSGYFSDEQECVQLVSQILAKNLASKFNISSYSSTFSANEQKKNIA